MSGPFIPIAEPKTAKFKVDDIVLIYKKKAKITKVIEQKYAPADSYIFFMYEVQWLEDTPIETTLFNETAISPFVEEEYKKNPCECGAWATFMPDNHSDYCPMYNLKRIKIQE